LANFVPRHRLDFTRRLSADRPQRLCFNRHLFLGALNILKKVWRQPVNHLKQNDDFDLLRDLLAETKLRHITFVSRTVVAVGQSANLGHQFLHIGRRLII
jgi:hypothetical protein